jgi:poly(3-hydroxybutyrate) depolymerase
MFRNFSVIPLMAVLTLAWLSTVTAQASAGCGKAATIRTQTYTTTVNGKQRQYHVRLPDNYTPDRPYRLIFTYHQLGGSMQKIVNGEDPNRGGALPFYGLPPLSNNSAVFVVPEGLNNGWGNAGGEDLAFFDQMVQAVEAGLCIDTRLRFSTGFSYGGAMSFAIACARPKVIRAVAVLSGAQLSGCQGGKDPVAYYAQHGVADSVLPVASGRQLRDQFVRNNGCTAVTEPQPNGAQSVMTKYKGCKEGYPITWVVHKGDHNPSEKDGNSNTPFAPKNTWEFFSQFS